MWIFLKNRVNSTLTWILWIDFSGQKCICLFMLFLDLQRKNRNEHRGGNIWIANESGDPIPPWEKTTRDRERGRECEIDTKKQIVKRKETEKRNTMLCFLVASALAWASRIIQLRRRRALERPSSLSYSLFFFSRILSIRSILFTWLTDCLTTYPCIHRSIVSTWKKRFFF